jgi:ABC-type microcin C transport system duplicated ATPase subunit YejF
MTHQDTNYILQTSDLKVYFPVKAGIILDRVLGWVKAVDGVDLTLRPSQVVGLVGESGSGKTTLGKAILLLVEATDGELLFQGKSVCAFNKEEINAYRRSVKAVFQDPFASLSPRLRIREIIGEPLEAGTGMKKIYRFRIEDKRYWWYGRSILIVWLLKLRLIMWLSNCI